MRGRLAIVVALAGCGRVGFGDVLRVDALADDGGDGDGVSDGGELPYVTIDPAWTGSVYYDFSSAFMYVAVDFVDGAEMYDNQPDSMFALDAPYSPVLAVIAGRDIFELLPGGPVKHAFGAHPPNTPGFPDHIRTGVWGPNINAGAPGVLISSSSADAGDGTFLVSTSWTLTMDRTVNNTRVIAWDAAGTFDARGAAGEGYLGTQTNVVRRSDNAVVLAGDTKTIRMLGADMLITRTVTIDVDVRLIRVGSNPYPETELAQANFIELGEGNPPSPGIAWALFDAYQLKLVGTGGVIKTVAQNNDPDVRWQAAVTPPEGHPLHTATNIVYVLETNRVLDRDRVLVFTSP